MGKDEKSVQSADERWRRKDRMAVLQDKVRKKREDKQREDRGDSSNVSAVGVKMERAGWRRAAHRRVFLSSTLQ